jgi:rubrerythrin
MLENLTLRSAVEFAVKTEEMGAALYERLTKRFPEDQELRELFSTLARDERMHEGQFRAHLGQLPPEKTEGVQYERADYLRAMSISEIFHGERFHQAAEAITSREDALELCLSLEKSTLLYYEAMKEVLGGSEVLQAIIAAEKEHVVKVARYLITGAKMRGLSDPY